MLVHLLHCHHIYSCTLTAVLFEHSMHGQPCARTCATALYIRMS